MSVEKWSKLWVESSFEPSIESSINENRNEIKVKSKKRSFIDSKNSANAVSTSRWPRLTTNCGHNSSVSRHKRLSPRFSSLKASIGRIDAINDAINDSVEDDYSLPNTEPLTEHEIESTGSTGNANKSSPLKLKDKSKDWRVCGLEVRKESQRLRSKQKSHLLKDQMTEFDTKETETSQTNEENDDKSGNKSYRKSVVNYFEELNKCLNSMKSNKFETSLQMRASKVLQKMKRLRLEFCQINSIKSHDSKALLLRIINIESKYGLTFIHSVVFNDENNDYSRNTPIILVINEQLTHELESDSIIKLYPRWTELRVKDDIYFINAFNIEITKDVINV